MLSSQDQLCALILYDNNPMQAEFIKNPRTARRNTCKYNAYIYSIGIKMYTDHLQYLRIIYYIHLY